jgi:hypothetical protein
MALSFPPDDNPRGRVFLWTDLAVRRRWKIRDDCGEGALTEATRSTVVKESRGLDANGPVACGLRPAELIRSRRFFFFLPETTCYSGKIPTWTTTTAVRDAPRGFWPFDMRRWRRRSARHARSTALSVLRHCGRCSARAAGRRPRR